MKSALWLLISAALNSAALGQGTVLFWNNSSTLISTLPIISDGPRPNYYFGLLTGPAGATDPTLFTFTGAYGTNQLAAGRFTGGVVAIDGWAAGEVRSFMVAGWDTTLGHDFRPGWLGQFNAGVGFSDIATGSPGGINPVTGGPDPALPIFGASSIAQGFGIWVVPEPAIYALAGFGLGAAMVLRRKSGANRKC